MHIVLLTNFYPPEIRSISGMMRELAEGLRARGHRVTVVTSWPKDNIAPEARAMEFLQVVIENGIQVIRVKRWGGRTRSYVMRGINELLLPYFFKRAIRAQVSGSVDAVIAYIPHLPMASVGAWMKKRFRARYVLNVQDIFPQNAIDAGILKQPLLIRLYERIARIAYERADALTTHTSGGEAFLIQRYSIPREKITTVYNWVSPAAFNMHSMRSGIFRKQFHLGDDFIFLFAGILGPTQGLDLVLETARLLADESRIRFLFVGEGTEKQRLVAKAKALQLTNVQFEDFVSPAQYQDLLSDVDVGLMCLDQYNTTAVVPGKLFGYMAAALPVLALLQPASEGHRIIAESGCGYSISSGNPRAACALVRQMYAERDALHEKGRLGYAYAQTHFSAEQCIAKLASLIGA